jgi:hypothetical protein
MLRIALALFISSLATTACIQKPSYKQIVKTTDALQTDRLAVLDSKYSSNDLCEDYRFLKNLIYYIHFDVKNPPPNVPVVCPQKYSDFVIAVRKTIFDLRDLHTAVQFGNGLDPIKLPVISRCEGDARCQNMVGATLQTIPTTVSDKFYGFIFTSKQQPVALSLLTVNGRPLADYRSEMKANHLYSHTDGNWSQSIPDYVLSRTAISERNVDGIEVEAEDIVTHSRIKFRLAYNIAQKIFGSVETQAILQSVGVGRGYGCKTIMQGSGYAGGACLNGEGKIIAWLNMWPDVEQVFKKWSQDLSDWLVANKGKESIVYFDIRSNVGGDPLSVMNFMCKFGSASTVQTLDGMSLKVRTWPETFDLGSKKLVTKDLGAFDNLPIQKIDAGFNVADLVLSEPRFHSYSTWERAGISIADCRKSQTAELKDMNWRILTDGNEFSSAEDFLFIAHRSPEKFKIYGRPSVGASGYPTWIPLPKTNTGIRLSTARDVVSNSIIIEKQGITPDFPLDQLETAAEFEARLIRILNGESVVDFSIKTLSKAIEEQFIR